MTKPGDTQSIRDVLDFWLLPRNHPDRLGEMRAAWEKWDTTMPPIPAEAGVRLVYGKKDMP